MGVNELDIVPFSSTRAATVAVVNKDPLLFELLFATDNKLVVFVGVWAAINVPA